MPTAVTTTDCFLEQISNQLAEQNRLLGQLVDLLRPSQQEDAVPEPEQSSDVPADPEPVKAERVMVDGAGDPPPPPVKKAAPSRSKTVNPASKRALSKRRPTGG